MKYNYSSKASVWIQAPAEKVWDALTVPEQIKAYFFGTECESDWKEGSTIFFRGEWEGKSYEDKGHVLKSEKPKLIKYDYWSNFSPLPDEPENYQVITYELVPENGGTRLNVTQENVATSEMAEHSEQNWNGVFAELKKFVESR